MSHQIEPNNGRGHLRWNGGGWLGATLGGSTWMLVSSGFLLIYGQQAVALVPSFAFSISVFCGAILWGRRNSLPPYQAMMILTGLFAVLFPAVFFIVLFAADEAVLAKMNWTATPLTIGVVVGICPATMAYFWYLERQARADNV